MRRLSICLAAVLIITSGFATASFAGPQGYCESFAREAASRKTGHTDAPAGTIGSNAANTASAGTIASDSKWREAYDTAFSGCMSQYESQNTAAAKINAPDAKAAKPTLPAKVSRPHRSHHAARKKAVSRKAAGNKSASNKIANKKAVSKKAASRKVARRKASPPAADIKAAGNSSDDARTSASEKAAPVPEAKAPVNPAPKASKPSDTAAASKAKPQDSEPCHTLACLFSRHREKQ